MQANLSELITNVTRLLALKRQIAGAEGKALVFVAISEDSTEFAAVATTPTIEGGQQTWLRVLLEAWQDRHRSLNFLGLWWGEMQRVSKGSLGRQRSD